MMRLLGRISLALWIMALIVGTIIRFTYMQAPPDGADGCYFANLGTMRIACSGFPGAEIIAFIFSMAWYWTWGLWWQLTDIPYSFDVLVPAGAALWFALNYLFDFTGPDEDEQGTS